MRLSELLLLVIFLDSLHVQTTQAVKATFPPRNVTWDIRNLEPTVRWKPSSLSSRNEVYYKVDVCALKDDCHPKSKSWDNVQCYLLNGSKVKFTNETFCRFDSAAINSILQYKVRVRMRKNGNSNSLVHSHKYQYSQAAALTSGSYTKPDVDATQQGFNGIFVDVTLPEYKPNRNQSIFVTLDTEHKIDSLDLFINYNACYVEVKDAKQCNTLVSKSSMTCLTNKNAEGKIEFKNLKPVTHCIHVWYSNYGRRSDVETVVFTVEQQVNMLLYVLLGSVVCVMFVTVILVRTIQKIQRLYHFVKQDGENLTGLLNKASQPNCFSSNDYYEEEDVHPFPTKEEMINSSQINEKLNFGDGLLETSSSVSNPPTILIPSLEDEDGEKLNISKKILPYSGKRNGSQEESPSHSNEDDLPVTFVTPDKIDILNETPHDMQKQQPDEDQLGKDDHSLTNSQLQHTIKFKGIDSVQFPNQDNIDKEDPQKAVESQLRQHENKFNHLDSATCPLLDQEHNDAPNYIYKLSKDTKGSSSSSCESDKIGCYFEKTNTDTSKSSSGEVDIGLVGHKERILSDMTCRTD